MIRDMRRLTKDSAAIKLLCEKFQSSYLDWSDIPKDVWDSKILFRQHKLTNFCVHFKAMAREYARRKDEDLIALDGRVTGVERSYSTMVEEEAPDDEFTDEVYATVEEVLLSSKVFQPLYLTSV
ncbi:hypothetical protein FGB62_306g03 [Gracilaria domingensis]|nr:hypothetical protein FGB62_306g03 [Gracilaria domingensis]